MLGEFKVSPPNPPSNLIDQLFPPRIHNQSERVTPTLTPVRRSQIPTPIILQGIGLGCLRLHTPFHPSNPRFALTHPVPTRAFRPLLLFLRRSGQGCPLLRASNEHSFTVRVLRARKAPGRSLHSSEAARCASKEGPRPHPNLFFSNSFTFPGFALPPLAFIT